jgi:hypothetical protein
MDGLMKGLAATVAMLLAALVLTSALAVGLQWRAMKQDRVEEGFSPVSDSPEDPSGSPANRRAQPAGWL